MDVGESTVIQAFKGAKLWTVTNLLPIVIVASLAAGATGGWFVARLLADPALARCEKRVTTCELMAARGRLVAAEQALEQSNDSLERISEYVNRLSEIDDTSNRAVRGLLIEVREVRELAQRLVNDCPLGPDELHVLSEAERIGRGTAVPDTKRPGNPRVP